LKEPKRRVNIDTLLASIVLPRLFFADREGKKNFALTEGMSFCSGRQDFCPVWIKVYFEKDLQEIFKNLIYEDTKLPGDSEVKVPYLFRGYTAVIEVGEQENKGERKRQEVHLKSIKRFF